MRVAFLTNTSCRVNAAVREALRNIDDVHLSHVFLYDTLAEFKRHPLRAIRQFGLLPILHKAMHLVAPQANTRAPAPSLTALKWCQNEGIPYSIVSNINEAASIELLRSAKADVLLVCVCKNILREAALSTCKLGSVNIHPSLLPKYRGPCPTFWTRYYQEEQVGVTLHRMTRKIDSGAILGQYSMQANYNLADDEIESALFQLAAENLEPILTRLANGDTSCEVPTAPNAKYYPFPTAQQRKELNQRRPQE